LQKTLKEHAEALGILTEEPAKKANEGPADLAAYRKRKQGAA
jgi:hypothetical protein